MSESKEPDCLFVTSESWLYQGSLYRDSMVLKGLFSCFLSKNSEQVARTYRRGFVATTLSNVNYKTLYWISDLCLSHETLSNQMLESFTLTL